MNDKERLDYLDSITSNVSMNPGDDYKPNIICRWSCTGRGWRLHEGHEDVAQMNVRDAIDAFRADNEVQGL